MSIKIRELTHIYSEGSPYCSVALNSVTLDIEDGDFFGIIGHTGSGKSTLVQHLNGLLKPKSGNIVIGGTDITKNDVSMRKVRRNVGLVFQYPEYQLFEENVYKDVAFGPLNMGLSENETDDCVREAFALVGLPFEEICERSPFELSGGQKRRAAIAGVISMKPEILILDEPTAGLDPKTHENILEMIANIHKTTGNITILVSHNMQDIAKYCNRVAVLQNGGVLIQGTPEYVFGQKDKLVSAGLDIPPTMDFMHRLKERGLKVDVGMFDEDAAVNEILGALEQRRDT